MAAHSTASRVADPIVFAFCISDSYAQHSAVVIASILESNPDETFVFHILASHLEEVTKLKLASMEACGRMQVHFHTVDAKIFERFPAPLAYISREAYYRYLIPELIDAPRVIYSDVDVLVWGPVRELWEAPLTDEMPMAAVRDSSDFWPINPEAWQTYRKAIQMPEGAPCFASGLLVMDCERLRAEKAAEKLLNDTAWCIENLPPEVFTAADQVVINRVFARRLYELPLSYCVIDNVKKHWKGPILIRHYAGYYEKPWCNVAWNWEWIPYWKILRKTPYRSRALGFLLRHLWGVVWSVHVKNGTKRAFLFGLRIYKKKLK